MSSKGLMIGSCLLAIVLLGALPAALAQEADSSTHDDAKATHPQAKPGSSQSQASEDAAPVAGSKTPDDIDTRISVQPRRVGAKPDKVGEAKAKLNLPVAKNLHRRTFSASAAASHRVRNAISVPLTQREGAERHESGHMGSPIAPFSAAGTVGTVGNTAVGLPRPTTGLSRLTIAPPNASPIVGPTVLNRGINGTNLGHRGAGPSGIGGPAKTVAGVNGTTIRPIH